MPADHEKDRIGGPFAPLVSDGDLPERGSLFEW